MHGTTSWYNLQDVCQLQLEDVEVGTLLRSKEQGVKLNSEGKSLEFCQLLQLWDLLMIYNSLLYRHEDTKGSSSHIQIVIPKKTRPEILQDLHSGVIGGHLGWRKC